MGERHWEISVQCIGVVFDQVNKCFENWAQKLCISAQTLHRESRRSFSLSDRYISVTVGIVSAAHWTTYFSRSLLLSLSLSLSRISIEAGHIRHVSLRSSFVDQRPCSGFQPIFFLIKPILDQHSLIIPSLFLEKKNSNDDLVRINRSSRRDSWPTRFHQVEQWMKAIR